MALLNEEDEWYNITQVYKEDMTLSIRTVELITGRWYVYVYVTDSDGKTVGLDFDFGAAPQEIIIIPDTFSVILPWIVFFIGLGLGLAAGIGLGYFRLRAKLRKEKEPYPKKDVGKQKKTTAPKKISESKKVQKEETKPEKPVKGLKSSRDEKETKKPQRKIKRRLK